MTPLKAKYDCGTRWLPLILAAGLLVICGLIGRADICRASNLVTPESVILGLEQAAKSREPYELSDVTVAGDGKTEEVRISNLVFNGDLSFSFTNFNQPMVFKNCRFKAKVSVFESGFQGEISFIKCVFEDDFDFLENCVGNPNCGRDGNDDSTASMAGISSAVSKVSFFNKSVFNKTVRLTGSVFHAPVDFSECRFYGDAQFGKYPGNEFGDFEEGKQDEEKRAVFKSGVTFHGSHFLGKAFFPYTEFSGTKDGPIDFSETVFKSEARFSKAKFRGFLNFSRAIFESRADFERAVFYPLDGQSGERQLELYNTSNFYKIFFKKDVSFSKSVFLTSVDFKRANFGGKLLLTDSFFAGRVNFESCYMGREVLGSKINDRGRLKREMTYYKYQEAFKKSGEITPSQCEETRKFIRKKFGDEKGWLPPETNCNELRNGWKGKEAYIGETMYAIFEKGDLQGKNNEFVFTGSHFGGEVDFRRGRFGTVDFRSGDIMTVFQKRADFSEARFGSVYFDEAVFLGKVYLPMLNLFAGSGIISRSVTLPDLLLARPWRMTDLDENDSLKSEAVGKRKKLYQALEQTFRSDLQIMEANEMAIRAAWLTLKDRQPQDKLASFMLLFALPIKNILVLVAAFNLYFYMCLLFTARIRARTDERSFRPGKLPLLYISSIQLSRLDKAPDRGETKDQMKPGPAKQAENLEGYIETPHGNKKVHGPRWWQRFTWPLSVCLGTFFAIVSMGSEYVTDDASCLKQMKILRIAGFILLPLLVYSLAKRSEGLHAIATFF